MQVLLCCDLMSQDTDTLPTRPVRPGPIGVPDSIYQTPTFDPSQIPDLSRRSDQELSPVGQEEEGLEYGSVDSNFIDVVNSRIHLYGQAFVRYEDFEVTSDYIVLDLNSNEVMADTRSRGAQRPKFKTGEQEVVADKLRYNIDSEKGIVHGARLQMNELYILGAVTKFVKAGSDSLHIDDVVYNKSALITTCDKNHPHWGIRTSKLKLIPDKLAVVGPSLMELGGIPTPLVMPFAFAPLFNFSQSSSGLLAPEEMFHTSPNLGFGIRGLGYHFDINDYMNMEVRADLYTRGSWALRTSTDYRKRYKHTGSIDLSFSRQLSDVQGEIGSSAQNAYAISINHRQDSRAHPYRQIGGTLRFTVNNFDRRNFSDAESQLRSTINSNFSYNYKISNVLNFSTAVTHSQNTQTNSINFTLPDMKLRLSRIFPFKKGGGSSANEKWFEKINFQYNGAFQNSVATVDTLLFTGETLGKFRSGLSHEMNLGGSYSLAQNLNFNVSADYDEFWYFQTYRLSLDSLGTTTGSVVPDFKPYRDLALSANLTTNLFGTILFKKGWLRGLRHEMTPTVGFSFSPSTEHYNEFLDTDPDIEVEELEEYNPFLAQGGDQLFRRSTLSAGGASITYGLRNRIRGKYYSKKDSTEKKFELFTVNFSGTYNLFADSLNFSTISMNASSRILKGLATISVNGTFDPYVKRNNVRINRTVWSEGRILPRLERLSATLNMQFTLQQIADLIKGKTGQGGSSASRQSRSRTRGRNAQQDEYPDFFSWFEGFRFSYNYRIGLMDTDRDGKNDFSTSAHSVRITIASIPLSDKWSMGVGNLSYDIKNSRWVYPSFSLSRDLHCWQMSISWQPAADTYSFGIGVKARPFSDYIKYQTGRRQFDNTRFR